MTGQTLHHILLPHGLPHQGIHEHIKAPGLPPESAGAIDRTSQHRKSPGQLWRQQATTVIPRAINVMFVESSIQEATKLLFEP